jgi:hypothetical protein
MRIERVTALAFGPFDGESLDLAPGLTVVSGPNESGKSTWHAALRAAICGVRRGRGANTKADAAFEEHHRPWDGDGRWAVEVRLALDDGRTIEISQDLAGKVACRATDVVLGRDVSDEIMDGTPDASRWLGLDRDAFGATICVGQAQLAAIAGRDTAAALQEHMQRAAATRGTDATAAEARARLDEFRRQQVGVDRQNARGPLRSARVRVETARAALEDARLRHDAFLEASAGVEAAERVAATLALRTATAEAALARQAADELAARVARAAALAARHPTEPAAPASRDASADAVAAALDAWRGRPRLEPLDGSSAAELEAEIASLPPPPVGDVEVDSTVVAARRALDRADDAVTLLGSRPDVPAVALDGPDEDELRALARRLRASGPERPEAGAVADAAPASVAPWAAAAVAALAAAASLAIGQPVVAGVAALVAVALAAWAVVGARSAGDATAALAHRQAQREREAAAQSARSAGLPIDPDELERLAEARRSAARAAEDVAAWDGRRAELQRARIAAADALTAALRARTATVEGPPVDAFVAYEVACRRRAQEATRSGSRAALVGALAARRAAEAAAAEAARSVERAAAALRAAATGAGIATDTDLDGLAGALEGWRRARIADAEGADQARREWHELTTLLDGRRLNDLEEAAERAATRSASLEAKVDPAQVSSLAARPDLGQLIEIERDELDRAREEASSTRGALDQMRLDVPDVAEAEEALAEATSELDRVTSTSEVIDATMRLLRAAEERVHRDLAPILASGITRWLPRVSGGRYVDASVDPADLSVRVKEAATGRWRSALLLSEGTREQIYLLLRVAMAQQLVTTDETAPLLLDEVTAQADAERKAQLLDVLHELSSERQIVLFTHDDDVAAWAERSLVGERDRLVQLRAPAQRQAALR